MADADGESQAGLFKEVLERVTALWQQGHAAAMQQAAQRYLDSAAPELYRCLLTGVLDFFGERYCQALEEFRRAQTLMTDAQTPAAQSLCTGIYLRCQQMLPKSRRPVVIQGQGYWEKNLQSLRRCDAELAEELEPAAWPDAYVLVDLWGRAHLLARANQTLLLILPTFRDVLENYCRSRQPIAFGTIITGQEVIYCLERQVNIIHGMARAHYLFEPDAGKLKALFHLYDFGAMLERRDLLIFAGKDIGAQTRRLFATLRYPSPQVTLGNTELVQGLLEPVLQQIEQNNPEHAVKAYYASQAFRRRQRQIADGELMPRILVDTCRWTTFLQYCAADFYKAFQVLGCEARFLIEENDVQCIQPALHWKILEEFRPDAVFMVSHSRQTVPYFPAELPFIGFIQDKCGPILQMADLTGHIAAKDLFVCMMTAFQDYLLEKRVPRQQTFVMPIPADETMFYPLPRDYAHEQRFDADIGFVKHGHAHQEKVWEDFLQEHTQTVSDARLRQALTVVLSGLYKQTCSGNDDTCRYEQEMQEYVRGHLTDSASDALRDGLRQIVAQFYITVYSAAWRCRFLEALDQSGFELALFGGGWGRHRRLGHLARGPVDRSSQLNLVYNFNRINLSINHCTTMHQRLAECGLAGGFMMVADHPQPLDWEPARRYFEQDREVVFFSSQKDLVEKAAYYLSHDQPRQAIAAAMHKRAAAQRTCQAAAGTILKVWRELLQSNP